MAGAPREHQQHLGLLGEGPPARFMSVAGTNQQPSRRLQHLAASLRPRSASGTGMATGAAHKLLGAWLDPAQRIGAVRPLSPAGRQRARCGRARPDSARARRQVEEFPSVFNIDEAYAIQAAYEADPLVQQLGGIAGYKVRASGKREPWLGVRSAPGRPDQPRHDLHTCWLQMGGLGQIPGVPAAYGAGHLRPTLRAGSAGLQKPERT